MKGKNEITVYGGSKDRTAVQSPLNYRNIHPAEAAFIMDDPQNDNFLATTDIGIVISQRPLFDPDQLKMSLLINDKPPILPICMAVKDLDFTNQDLHGVGWGLTYDESQEGKRPRNPYYSSCMTNELGKEEWRFKACNMEQIQRLHWSCEKNTLPTDINTDFLRCRKYFEGARRIFHNPMFRKFMDRVNKIFVYEGSSRKKLVCYNEREFTKRGWCEIQGHSSSKGAWGFCSPSCNQQLMKV